MDWDGVKPGLGWLNGITHDIFLDYFFDELILFCLINLSYVSMRISGNESGRACSASLFGSECVIPIRPGLLVVFRPWFQVK